MQNQPEQQWSQGQDSSNNDSVNSVNSEQIKNRISLSNTELRQLSTDDAKFFKTIKETNDKAVERIINTSSKEALIYLAEAERILEYGACCGKVIDRNLIICVLHNQAAAFQRIWALDKCSKYIEGVIYNIQVSLTNDAQLTSAISFTQPSMKSRDYQILCSVSKRKLSLVQYYLQYCAIMSQQKNHQVALTSSFRAVSLMKQLLSTFYKYYKAYALEQRSELMTYAKKLKMLRQLSNYKQDMSLQNYESILKRTRWVFKEWRTNKNVSGENEDVQTWIKNYSIGNAMQMEPFLYNDYDAPLSFKRELEQDSIIKKVLLFAISYFTVATEIRLIEVDKYPNNEEEKRKSEEFQRSELFHLTSIKIFCTYVPYESVFIKHVLHSYSNHYKPELNVEEVSMIADDQFDDMSNTVNQSSRQVEVQSPINPNPSMSPLSQQPIKPQPISQQSPINSLNNHHQQQPHQPHPQSHPQSHPIYHKPTPPAPQPPKPPNQHSQPSIEQQRPEQPPHPHPLNKFKKKKPKKILSVKTHNLQQVEINNPQTARSNLHTIQVKPQSPRIKSNTMFSEKGKRKDKSKEKMGVVGEVRGNSKLKKDRESMHVKHNENVSKERKSKPKQHKMRKPVKLTEREPQEEYFPRKENKSKPKKKKGTSSKKKL